MSDEFHVTTPGVMIIPGTDIEILADPGRQYRVLHEGILVWQGHHLSDAKAVAAELHKELLEMQLLPKEDSDEDAD